MLHGGYPIIRRKRGHDSRIQHFLSLTSSYLHATPYLNFTRLNLPPLAWLDQHGLLVHRGEGTELLVGGKMAYLDR